MVLFIGNIAYFNSVSDQLETSAAEQHRIGRASAAAQALVIEVLRVTTLLDAYAREPDGALLLALFDARQRSGAKQEELRRHSRLPAVLQALDRYRALLPQRIAAADRIIAAVENGEDFGQLRRQRSILDHRAQQQLSTIIAIEEQALSESTRSDERIRRSTRWRISLVAVLNLALVTVMVLVIAGDLKRRLAAMNRMARQIEKGDFSARVPVIGADEIDALAERFNAMAQELGALEKTKDEFVALASHQLRTPATAVKGNVGMLLEGYCGDLTLEQQSVLRDAYESNERQLAVIEDMLNVSRIEAGRMVLFKSATDLAAMVRSVAAEQKAMVDSRGQELVVEAPPGPVVLAVDPQRFRMVVENLLSNASKYTPSSGRIEIRLEQLAVETRISVLDTGVGIPEASQYRLFHKFSRIDNPLSILAGGNGLGLYLANEIVELHGGTISVQSALGAGSTFTVVLPRGE